MLFFGLFIPLLVIVTIVFATWYLLGDLMPLYNLLPMLFYRNRMSVTYHLTQNGVTVRIEVHVLQ